MSQSPVLCLPIDEELQLRLYEEQYAEEYFALLERNRTHLREWMPWAASAGSLEETKASMKQTLLQLANTEELQ
jgi:ribosomal-protein-serine acetyltransferase